MPSAERDRDSDLSVIPCRGDASVRRYWSCQEVVFFRMVSLGDRFASVDCLRQETHGTRRPFAWRPTGSVSLRLCSSRWQRRLLSRRVNTGDEAEHAMSGPVDVVRGVVKNIGVDSFVDVVRSGSQTVRLLLVILDHKRSRWRASFDRQACLVSVKSEFLRTTENRVLRSVADPSLLLIRVVYRGGSLSWSVIPDLLFLWCSEF